MVLKSGFVPGGRCSRKGTNGTTGPVTGTGGVLNLRPQLLTIGHRSNTKPGMPYRGTDR